MAGHEHHFNVEHLAMLMSAERVEWGRPAELLAAIAVGPGMRVADVGCGPGFFALPLAEIVGETGRVYAIDDSPKMLRALAEGAAGRGFDDRAELREADAAATGLPVAAVDVTLCAFVYHEVADRAALLVELARITRPGGRVVMLDWRKGVATEHGPGDHVRLTRAEMVVPMETAGLTVRELDFSADYAVLIGSKAGAASD
jgi:ubiquinone/menaquinone biosynthesis C-methylase UbiE